MCNLGKQASQSSSSNHPDLAFSPKLRNLQFSTETKVLRVGWEIKLGKILQILITLVQVQLIINKVEKLLSNFSNGFIMALYGGMLSHVKPMTLCNFFTAFWIPREVCRSRSISVYLTWNFIHLKLSFNSEFCHWQNRMFTAAGCDNEDPR